MEEEDPPTVQYVELQTEPAEVWVVGENSQSSEEDQINGEHIVETEHAEVDSESVSFPTSGVCQVVNTDAPQREDSETHVVFQGAGAGKEEIVVKIFPVVGAYEEIPCVDAPDQEVDVSCQEAAEDLESENGGEAGGEVIGHQEFFHHYAKTEIKTEEHEEQAESSLPMDPDVKSRYCCDYCDTMFSRAGDLKDHLVTHMKHDRSSEGEVSMDTEESDIPSDSQSNKAALSNMSNMFEKTAARLRKHLEMQEESQLTVAGLDALSRQADVMEPLLTSTENAAVLATKPHVCGICYKAYSKASKLRKHLLTHNESPTNSMQIARMDVARAKLKKLLETEQEAGRVEDQTANLTKTYLCGICFQAFDREARLNKHLETHKHESVSADDVGEESMEEDVERPAPTKRRSRSTKRAKKTTKKPYQCEFCSKSFNKVSKLKKHLKIHEEQESESPAEEDSADDETVTKSRSRSSGGNKSPRSSTQGIPKLYEYECQVCDRTFDRPCNLKYHLYSHEETKHLGVPPPQHVCDLCNKNFTRPYFLRKHLLETHQIDRASPRPAKKAGRKSTSSSRLVAGALSPRKKTMRCEICDKAFDRPCNLKYHLYSHKETRHLGVPPPVHMCGTCGKEFNRPVLLRHHERYCKLDI